MNADQNSDNWLVVLLFSDHPTTNQRRLHTTQCFYIILLNRILKDSKISSPCEWFILIFLRSSHNVPLKIQQTYKDFVFYKIIFYFFRWSVVCQDVGENPPKGKWQQLPRRGFYRTTASQGKFLSHQLHFPTNIIESAKLLVFVWNVDFSNLK